MDNLDKAIKFLADKGVSQEKPTVEMSPKSLAVLLEEYRVYYESLKEKEK